MPLQKHVQQPGMLLLKTRLTTLPASGTYYRDMIELYPRSSLLVTLLRKPQTELNVPEHPGCKELTDRTGTACNLPCNKFLTCLVPDGVGKAQSN